MLSFAVEGRKARSGMILTQIEGKCVAHSADVLQSGARAEAHILSHYLCIFYARDASSDGKNAIWNALYRDGLAALRGREQAGLLLILSTPVARRARVIVCFASDQESHARYILGLDVEQRV